MITLFRTELGAVLRTARHQRNLTLRDVSIASKVSLGHISEVERGKKELSSEVLASMCDALDVPQSVIIGAVADRLSTAETPVPAIASNPRRWTELARALEHADA